jgi:hypothetical protein
MTDGVYVLRKTFSRSETKRIQYALADLSTFSLVQRFILSKIKQRLNVKWLHVGFSRFSDNNNYDAQAFHRDVKPHWLVRGNYPNIYTIICYLDTASLSFMFNDVIDVNPGDVVVFNSTNLHKANDITGRHGKRRRVLQYFHAFFDKSEMKLFHKDHIFHEHTPGQTFGHILGHDVLNIIGASFPISRAVVEYLNLATFFNYTNLKPFKYLTNLQPGSEVATIDGVPCYRYF